MNGKLIELSPSEKFVIIKDAIETSGVKNIIKYLCEVAEIFRISYYKYLSETSKTNKSNQELEDEKARDLIIKAYEFKGRQKGARQIKMTLENKSA
ncbi:hypothetical protein [Haliovirga abyssi]|uniref:hypothetical protein n=1 Tax=Haliovirga abyssi TaxID=2996794 RepID=UPI0027DDA8E3|nr:hypothetical protein [Haliovirga abyssi]